MSTIGGYPARAFSPTQKFLVLDPATQTTSLILGQDLVDYITPSLNQVFSETTRTAAMNEDYQVGQFIQTAGGTAIDDGANGLFLVVEGGTGDYPMLNGNDLLLLPFGSLAGSNLDGALVTDDAVQVEIEDAIALRPVRYPSMEALRLSTTSHDYVETSAFYASGTTGAAKLYRDGTGTPTGSGAAVIAAALAAGTFCNAAGVCYKIAPGQYITPSIYGATGGADDADFLQVWASRGGALSVDRDYNSSETITLNVARTTISGNRYKITFDDAAGAGIVLAAQGCIVHGLYGWGTDTSTPTIDMIRVSGANGAYAMIQDCNIAYARRGIDATTGSYIIHSYGNVFSNCYYYEYLSGVTDFTTSANTFGTSTFLTAAIFGTGSSPGHIIDGNYFETESRSWSCQIGSSCSAWSFTDNTLFGCGGVLVEAPSIVSGNTWNGGRPDTTYTAIIRLMTNAVESIVSNNKFSAYYSKGGTPSAGTAISCSVNDCVISLNQIRFFDVGIVTTTNYHTIVGNRVKFCGYGMRLLSASNNVTLVGNVVTDSDTRDYDIQSGAATMIGFDNIGLVQGLSKRSGTTANRPTLTASQVGYFYLDTTLDADGKPIWWNGTAWIDATGATV